MYQIWKIKNVDYDKIDKFWKFVKDSDMSDPHLELIGEFREEKYAVKCASTLNFGNYSTECRYNPCNDCEANGTDKCIGTGECECIKEDCNGCPWLRKHYYEPYKMMEVKKKWQVKKNLQSQL